MTIAATTLPDFIPDPPDDIDWELLLLLARVEAALIWPDQAPPEGFILAENSAC